MPQTDTPTRPAQSSGMSFRRLWANGWGARLVLIGCVLSFLALWDSWGMNVTGGGYSITEHHSWGKETTYRPSVTAQGGNAFAIQPLDSLFWVGFLAASLVSCARSRGGAASWLRWVPLGLAVVLVINIVAFQLTQSREDESRRAEATRQGRTSLTTTPGAGPNLFLIGQLIAGVGGALFALRRTGPQGTAEQPVGGS